MTKKIKILHLEDSSFDSEIVRSLIEIGQIENDYFLTDKELEYKHILETEPIDIIISDYNLPDYNGNEALKVARANYSHIPFIFVSGEMGEDAAINAMLSGATDYVLKNKLDRLVPAIKRAIHEYELVNMRKDAEVALHESEKQQSEGKEKQAAELMIANKELAFQNVEKEKRAAELAIANTELIFQNKEKEKRTEELITAYKELTYQLNEKEKRANELIAANKELIFQNEEKGKRAAELVIANKELAFQNGEKEKRAAELVITHKELVFQYDEREKRTAELLIANTQKTEMERSKHIIEEKNKDITDSINYAKRLQTAILPPSSLIKKHLQNSFVLYKPKDIVAGDFYWMEAYDNLVIFAACDCTGHGVPGALISVVCHNALNRAVREFDLKHPAAILDKTTELVIENFAKSEENIKDGMDISLCAYNKKTKTLEWAGANRPLWIIRNGQTNIEEIKATKKAIGGFTENDHNFDSHKIKLQAGDTFYIFSDGYADQFSGENGKKLMAKKFKQILIDIQDKPMPEQEQYLDEFLENWKAGTEQIDDILVIGVRT